MNELTFLIFFQNKPFAFARDLVEFFEVSSWSWSARTISIISLSQLFIGIKP